MSGGVSKPHTRTGGVGTAPVLPLSEFPRGRPGAWAGCRAPTEETCRNWPSGAGTVPGQVRVSSHGLIIDWCADWHTVHRHGRSIHRSRIRPRRVVLEVAARRQPLARRPRHRGRVRAGRGLRGSLVHRERISQAPGGAVGGCNDGARPDAHEQ
eukprot:scaffold9761_cov118-Isochrysis_galbana.AAC.5